MKFSEWLISEGILDKFKKSPDLKRTVIDIINDKEVDRLVKNFIDMDVTDLPKIVKDMEKRIKKLIPKKSSFTVSDIMNHASFINNIDSESLMSGFDVSKEIKKYIVKK